MSGAQYVDVFEAITDSGKYNAKAAAGRALWTTFNECIMLRRQHRFDLNDPDGRQLYDVVHQLTYSTHPRTGKPLTSDDLANLADLINSTAVDPTDMLSFLQTKPRALVLRHAVRPALTRHLVAHHAAVDKTRVIVWRQTDMSTAMHGSKHGRPLSKELLSTLTTLAPKADEMPAVQYFYPGIPYRFINNTYPMLGWVNNGTCIGNNPHRAYIG